MLKSIVLFSLIQALMAFPGRRTHDEIDELRAFLQKSKQESEISLKETMAKYPSSSAWENSGKYQGDIILFDEEIEDMVKEFSTNVTEHVRIARNALINTRHRWPGNIIPYEIPANTFSQIEIRMIVSAANFFSENSCVRWVRRSSQRDYVRITARVDGCYANVGYRQNSGAHTLNLARNGCMNRFIIIHEMLHVVGFNHMHQTFNRNEWISVNFANVIKGMKHNFDIFNSNVVTLLQIPYEYSSIQHYGPFAFSANNRPTIVAKRNNAGQMGQTTHVTKSDILRLQRLYNCPGAWSVEPNAADINMPYNEEFRQRMKVAASKETASRTVEDEEQLSTEDDRSGNQVFN